MNKTELLSDLWKEADRITLVRKKTVQLACCFLLIIGSYLVMLLYCHNVANLLSVYYWPLYLGYVAFCLTCYVFLPFGKISQKKVKKAFDEIIFERSQGYIDEINNMNEQLAREQRELNELNKKSNLLIEIISENS